MYLHNLQMQKLSTVFFDVGGVLLKLNGAEFNSAIVGKCRPGSPADIFPSRFMDVLGTEIDGYHSGSYARSDFIAKAHQFLAKDFGYSGTPAELLTGWGDFLGERMEDNLKIFSALSRNKNIQLGVISDTNEFHAEIMAQRIPDVLNSCAPGFCYLSHARGMRKAGSGALFQLALRETDARPSSILMIDDTSAILDTAKHLGMETLHYTSQVNLADALRTRGLEI